MQIATSSPTVVTSTLASLMSQLGRTKPEASQSSAANFAGSVASSASAGSSASNALIGNARPSLSDQVMGFLMQAQQQAGTAKGPGFTTTMPISDDPGVAA